MSESERLGHAFRDAIANYRRQILNSADKGERDVQMRGGGIEGGRSSVAQFSGDVVEVLHGVVDALQALIHLESSLSVGDGAVTPSSAKTVGVPSDTDVSSSSCGASVSGRGFADDVSEAIDRVLTRQIKVMRDAARAGGASA